MSTTSTTVGLCECVGSQVAMSTVGIAIDPINAARALCDSSRPHTFYGLLRTAVSACRVSFARNFMRNVTFTHGSGSPSDSGSIPWSLDRRDYLPTARDPTLDPTHTHSSTRPTHPSSRLPSVRTVHHGWMDRSARTQPDRPRDRGSLSCTYEQVSWLSAPTDRHSSCRVGSGERRY